MNKYYVYAHLRWTKDRHGEAGTPYYVGKGSGFRAFATQNRTTPLPPNRHCVLFIKEGLTEAEAFDMEIALITWYGRIDLATGCLLNKTPGGRYPGSTFTTSGKAIKHKPHKPHERRKGTSYDNPYGRPMTSAERQRRYRARKRNQS